MKFPRSVLGLLFIGASLQTGYAADKDATLQRAELGFQLPTFLGDAALRFNRGIGVTAAAYLNRRILHPQLEPVLTLQYQNLTYVGADSLHLHLFSLTVGVRALPASKSWGDLLPYFGLHLGPALNWIQSSAAGATTNSTLGGIISIAPGIEYSLSSALTANLSFPLYWAFNRSSNYAYVAQNLAIQYHF